MTPSNVSTSDAQLIASYQDLGDKQALDELVRRHIRKVYSLVFQMVLDDNVADDLTQDTFLRAFRGLDSFNGRSQFSTWLYRIALNTTYSYLDRHERSPVAFASDPPETEAEREAGPEQSAMQAEMEREIEVALSELSPKMRAALVLTSLQHLGTSEAAEIEGCSTSTLYWRVHKARKQLKRRLRKYLTP